MKKALVTGITGQDGSYLAELLLGKGYEVHGIIRRASTFNTSRIDHLHADPDIHDVRFFLHFGDVSDSTSLVKLLYRVQPDEIYNLAAQSHVRVSFDIPEYTGDVTALGAVRILEAIRETGLQAKFYQASSSEMYGKVQEIPQRETTPFYPRSPYAAAKLYAHWITVTNPCSFFEVVREVHSLATAFAEEAPNGVAAICEGGGESRRRLGRGRVPGYGGSCGYRSSTCVAEAGRWPQLRLAVGTGAGKRGAASLTECCALAVIATA